MNNVRCLWALPFVVAAICLAGATSAHAQGTGTLTGTIVDSSGSAVPGATVTATESETAAVRSVVSNENGLFRIAALNPGRYIVKVELTSFKPVTIEAISLSSAEIRDLGKVTLQVGAITETVSVTSEVTPVQVADSARRKTITGADLTEHPDERPRHLRPARGASRRPGHEPEPRLLVVDIGDPDHHQRRSVTEQGRPHRRHQHRRRRRMRHGVRQPEHGCGQRSAGHLERLHGGERPQQRRPDQRRHQVGHEHVQGVGLVQRPPRPVQRERLLPQGQQPGEAVVRRQHLRLRLRRTARDSGCDGQPQGDEEDVLLRVAGVHERQAADARRCAPTCRPRSSASATSRRRASTNGTIQPIIDPRTGAAVPRQHHPGGNASVRLGRRCSTCCRCPTAS